jgi:hypothetical protein
MGAQRPRRLLFRAGDPEVEVRRKFGRLFPLLLLAGPLSAAAAAPPAPPSLDPLEVLADHRAARLAPDEAVQARAAVVELGFARIELEDGWLIPYEAPSGRLLELLFLGHGRLAVLPPNPVESAQLELFTGGRQLDAGFSAVILAAPEARLRSLVGGGTAGVLEAEKIELAKSIYQGRDELAELQVLEVDTKLLLAAIGEEQAGEFFAAIFETEKHGVVSLGHDLEAEDPLGLGQWVEFAQKSAAGDEAGANGAAGGGEGKEAAETGQGGVYDAWVEGRDAGRPPPASLATFEPSHYALRLELDPAKGGLRGRALIDLEARLTSRVVKLALHQDLEISRVAEPGGDELHLVRDGENVRVFLPERLEAGAKTRLEVEFSGQFFESGKRRKSRGLRDNLAFYPHAGAVDEATYELELRWPRGWQVLAAGELVAEGQDGGFYWQRRKVDSPTWGPSFAIGKFRRSSRQLAGVRIDLALGAGVRGSEADQREILDTAASALQFYAEIFGPYERTELTLATAPAEISQAMLGFVALSDEMMGADSKLAAETEIEDRRTVIAHELAHQWWGHEVGWRNWRDQWISEAMANYAALLWARRYLPGLDPAKGPTGGWQDDLKAILRDGRSLESVGPLVLGGRLDSSLTQEAYEPIVYRKGAVVLDTLCQSIGERRCLEILGQLARESRGSKLSTESFLEGVERLSGRDLDAFARQFVYGTGLPEVYWRQQVEKTEAGRFRVTIEAELESSYHFRYALRKSGDGSLAVEQRRVDEVDLGALELTVPLRFGLNGPDGEPFEHQEKLEIAGPRASASFEFAAEPTKIELDPEGTIFARCWDLGGDPKRALYYQGFDRFAAGEPAAAKELLAAALAAKTPAAGSPYRKNDAAALQLDQALDASIELAKARIAFEEGDIPAAGAALTAAGKVLPKTLRELYASEIELLTARYAWHRGDPLTTFRKLERLLVEKAEIDDSEAWLYYALAASAAGKKEELKEARATLESRGIDTSLLN